MGVSTSGQQPPPRARLSIMTALMLLGAAGCAPMPPSAQPVNAPVALEGAAGRRPPGACEVPASERTEEIGCYWTAIEPLGILPADPLFWHIYTYPSRAAAEAARGPGATVVESFGRVLLYAVQPEGWRPRDGERLATVGPLPHHPGRQYTARYMEAAFRPGMRAAAHRHSGAEAWYMVEGAQCLETPDGITIIRAGENAIVPAGPPMVLTQVGEEIRRSLVLVLHESAEPWITRVDWTPGGRCPA